MTCGVVSYGEVTRDCCDIDKCDMNDATKAAECEFFPCTVGKIN